MFPAWDPEISMSHHRPKLVSTANLENLELKRLKSRVERLVMALEEALEVESPESYDSYRPPVDLSESGNSINVLIELPGVSHDDIDLKVSAKEVLVEGELRHSPDSEKVLSHFCCERQYGRFRRRIQLRWAIDIRKATASLADGLLHVVLPKLVDRRGKPVNIPVISEETTSE